MTKLRTPVPLRCGHCGEIIYDDEPWEEYTDDPEDAKGDPWHSACVSQYEIERATEARKHEAYLKGLRKRPSDSLNYEEALTLTADECNQSMLKGLGFRR